MKKLLLLLFLVSLITVDVFANSINRIDSILTHVSDYTENVLDLRLISDKELLEHLNTPINDLAKCKIYNGYLGVNEIDYIYCGPSQKFKTFGKVN